MRNGLLGLVLLLSIGSFAQKRVIVIGSSTALGSAATSYDSSYIGRLQAFYRKNTTAGNPDTIVSAVGGYGYTTYKFLPNGYVPPVLRHSIDGTVNVNAVLSMSPDVVIINLPGNDVSSYAQPWISPVYSTKETMDNFRVMYNFFVSNNVKCFVTTTQPRNDLDVAQRQLQRNLVDSITNNFGVFAINFWDDLVVPGGSNLLKDEVRNLGFSDQDYHLNNTGHRYVFERVKNKNIFQNTTPPPPPPPSYTNIPAKIESENYSAMSGIQTEPSMDAGGGLNVGYIDQGDWMDYNINATSAGSYNVALRVAALNSGGQLQIRKSDGTVLATVAIPQTGGWQIWQSINTTVNLNTGNQTLRIISTASANWNINWMEFTLVPPPPPSSGYTPIPARIEAENYLAHLGTLAEPTSDVGGGQNLGYIDMGDWMDYNISTSTASNFIFRARVASSMSGGQLQLKNSSGTVLATLNIPNTGSWQTWTTIETPITLSLGNQTVRVISVAAAGWNINWIEFVQHTVPPPSTSTRIEAENYSSMSGIQTETTSDAGGGLNVTAMDQFDWMEYTYNAPLSGVYSISFRLAAPTVGAELTLTKSDGTILGTMTVHPTGGLQVWQTLTAPFTLSAGSQTLRVVSTATGKWNFNWMELKPPTPVTAPTGYTTLPAKIEAENYSIMNGVQTENTTDVGGGQNVGYIGYGDWMDYQINVPNQGSYKLNLRVASAESGGQIQVKKSDGTILFTYEVPNTGGWQTWQTISGNFILSQGNQTIRVISNSNAGWNLNWLEFQTITSPAPPATTRIEAENFTNMSGIQTESTSDQGGGLNVGYIDNGDWMLYSYTAPVAGNYAISFRIASQAAGAQFQVYKSGGILLATVTVPQTGGWQNWQTINATINFSAGNQTFYLVSSAVPGWNINWIEITPPSSSSFTSRSQPVLIQPIQSEKISVNLFPNPVLDKFSIVVDHPYEGMMNAEFIDMNGKILKTVRLQKLLAGKTIHSVSVGSFPPGHYILRLSIKDWSKTILFQKRN